MNSSNEPIGITICSKKLVNEIIDMNLLNTSYKFNNIVKIDNIFNTTSKLIYFDKLKNNEYNMNSFLEHGIEIIEHVKKYKLKKIE